MPTFLRIVTLPAVMGLVMAPLLAQAEDKVRVNGHVEGGFEHDSNVSVDEINSSAEQSDQAWVFDAGLDGLLKPVDPVTVSLGYSLSGRRYQSLDQFDQNIHLVSADISYDFDPITIGTSYHYSHATLGANGSGSFLDFRRASVYLGSLIGDDVYLLASVQDKRKDFADSEARDADIRGASLDSFFFLNQARSHVVLGLDGERENARADAFDNDLLRFRATLVHKFTLGGEANRFRLGWRYEHREYDQVDVSGSNPEFNNPLTGGLTERTSSERTDRAQLVEASWRIGLSEVVSVEPSVSWGRYASNEASADYDKTVAGVTLRAAF